MPVRTQLPHFRQSLHGLALPRCVVILNEINHAWGKNKKSAVYPAAVTWRFFLETHHMVLLGPQGAKSPGGLYRRHRGQAAMRPVKCDKRRDVNIPHAIAIGKTEFIGADVLA